MELPTAPLLFAKWPNALVGHDDPIVLPPQARETDYEAELLQDGDEVTVEIEGVGTLTNPVRRG